MVFMCGLLQTPTPLTKQEALYMYYQPYMHKHVMYCTCTCMSLRTRTIQSVNINEKMQIHLHRQDRAFCDSRFSIKVPQPNCDYKNKVVTVPNNACIEQINQSKSTYVSMKMKGRYEVLREWYGEHFIRECHML